MRVKSFREYGVNGGHAASLLEKPDAILGHVAWWGDRFPMQLNTVEGMRLVNQEPGSVDNQACRGSSIPFDRTRGLSRCQSPLCFNSFSGQPSVFSWRKSLSGRDDGRRLSILSAYFE